jgi:hypothetical protein
VPIRFLVPILAVRAHAHPPILPSS